MLQASCRRVVAAAWRVPACRCLRHRSASLRTTTSRAPSALLPFYEESRSSLHSQHRLFSSAPPTSSSPPVEDGVLPPGAAESPGEKFVMLYTCTVCETRAAKTISKHAYYKGVVLVRCPGCDNLHLVADRLGWFDDESTDVESILRAKGEQVKVVTHENVLELTDADIIGSSSRKQE